MAKTGLNHTSQRMQYVQLIPEYDDVMFAELVQMRSKVTQVDPTQAKRLVLANPFVNENGVSYFEPEGLCELVLRIKGEDEADRIWALNMLMYMSSSNNPTLLLCNSPPLLNELLNCVEGFKANFCVSISKKPFYGPEFVKKSVKNLPTKILESPNPDVSSVVLCILSNLCSVSENCKFLCSETNQNVFNSWVEFIFCQLPLVEKHITDLLDILQNLCLEYPVENLLHHFSIFFTSFYNGSKILTRLNQFIVHLFCVRPQSILSKNIPIQVLEWIFYQPEYMWILMYFGESELEHLMELEFNWYEMLLRDLKVGSREASVCLRKIFEYESLRCYFTDIEPLIVACSKDQEISKHISHIILIQTKPDQL